MLVKRFPRNQLGRDFVVGDIHGSYELVVEALRAVRFSPTKDRLFCVGDLVDRGPQSHRVRRFLETPWVNAIRGNHEDMFLTMYANGEPDEEALPYLVRRNGMTWWADLPRAERLLLIKAFRNLPVAIEIETARGCVGLVHAEVTQGLDWQAFLQRVEAHDRGVIHTALWGRDRIETLEASGVEGVDRLFVGHSVVPSPQRLGNIYYVDTGAVFGLKQDDGTVGRMTLAGLTSSTRILSNPPADDLVDIRFDEPTAPFGAYAASGGH